MSKKRDPVYHAEQIVKKAWKNGTEDQQVELEWQAGIVRDWRGRKRNVYNGDLIGPKKVIHEASSDNLCGWCGRLKAADEWCDNKHCPSQKLRNKYDRDQDDDKPDERV